MLPYIFMKVEIRKYRPSDKDEVCTLFISGNLEHIRPCFLKAMSSPLHLTTTLSLCAAGYLLGSVFGAVVLPGVWVGLIYYCCHRVHSSYVQKKLQTDMQDIPGNYLSRQDDCFWVAEAEVDRRPRIIGMVAVLVKHSGKERQGEMFRMVILPLCRRMGLGFRMTQTVIDFCKERGFSELVLATTSSHTSAVAMYKKMGFSLVLSHINMYVSPWISFLSNVKILRMKIDLKS
uniref:N-acetyltransferase domain-containing protein n=1 Tax=Mola mola TaxID=94237 RepID=A0A3Q3VUB2_MOLML